MEKWPVSLGEKLCNTRNAAPCAAPRLVAASGRKPFQQGLAARRSLRAGPHLSKRFGLSDQERVEILVLRTLVLKIYLKHFKACKQGFGPLSRQK